MSDFTVLMDPCLLQEVDAQEDPTSRNKVAENISELMQDLASHPGATIDLGDGTVAMPKKASPNSDQWLSTRSGRFRIALWRTWVTVTRCSHSLRFPVMEVQ